ncbi:hypothetical protein [Neochlamydia sp. EPS4]|uniref:hypothetical protein n=1 Tax=Neochlamydia sp. EPS4 TaxID=1478175 RepID=UPI000694A332|nr:hypothetical protein [Neochlamydia sp. EPS4]
MLKLDLSPLELEFKWKTEEKIYHTLDNYSSYLININRLLIWKEISGGKEYLDQEAIKYSPLEKKESFLEIGLKGMAKLLRA